MKTVNMEGIAPLARLVGEFLDDYGLHIMMTSLYLVNDHGFWIT